MVLPQLEYFSKQVLNIVETVNPRSTIIRVVEESKPGKRAAMYTGLAYVDTEITVFADDDALYGPAVLKSLIMPFKDPAMGGCGTRQIARPKADTFKFEDIMMVSYLLFIGVNEQHFSVNVRIETENKKQGNQGVLNIVTRNVLSFGGESVMRFGLATWEGAFICCLLCAK